MSSYQLRIFSRCLAGFGGGYALASLFSIAATKLIMVTFEHPQGDSVLIATMLSFLVFFSVVIFSFSAERERSIWLSLVGLSTGLSVICIVIQSTPS